MFLLRVALPDRPGSLGAVATALGTVDADIFAVEIVEKLDDIVIDDFMISLPPGERAEVLVSACAGIDGVEVLWVSHYPESWSLQPDVDLLDKMAEDPTSAESMLCQNAPEVFHAEWALIVERATGDIVERTDLAPAPSQQEVDQNGQRIIRTTLTSTMIAEAMMTLMPILDAGSGEVPSGWLPGWDDTLVASAPIRRGSHFIVLGRHGGPEFLASELARLKYLAALAS